MEEKDFTLILKPLEANNGVGVDISYDPVFENLKFLRRDDSKGISDLAFSQLQQNWQKLSQQQIWCTQ